MEHEEHNGETQAKVKWVNASKYPECRHVWKEKDSDEAEQFAEIQSTDSDLPF